jgi:HK97 family phage major capsid protein
MATMIEEARHKLQAVVKEREEFTAKVLGGDTPPTEDDERKLEAMTSGEADIRTEIARLERFAQAGGSSRPSSEAGPNPAQRNDGGRPQILTLGDRLINSEQYKAAMARYAPDGRIPDSGGFQMGAMPFRGLAELFNPRAALITGDSSTSAGAFITPDRQAGYVDLGRQPLRIRDIIRVLQTESDLIEYVAQLTRVNRAAIVPEATSVNDGAKPESDMTFEVRTAPVRTVANWTPATKQSVADAPQFRGIINGELLDNLLEEEEDIIVNSASGIIGITQTSGTQTQAWDTNILTTTRKAKTIVGTVGRRVPTAYVLNPSDWETIDLLQDNVARYFYGGPAQVGVPRLWGLPVVESEAMAAGAALVGDFRRAVLWDREQGSISMTDSHADFFIRNLLAILAEERIAFALTQPNAIVEIDVAA